MKKTDYKELLEKFVHLMENEKAWLDATMTFAGICRSLGVPEEDMDGCLMDSFGTSGADILTVYRRGIPLYML